MCVWDGYGRSVTLEYGLPASHLVCVVDEQVCVVVCVGRVGAESGRLVGCLCPRLRLLSHVSCKYMHACIHACTLPLLPASPPPSPTPPCRRRRRGLLPPLRAPVAPSVGQLPPTYLRYVGGVTHAPPSHHRTRCVSGSPLRSSSRFLGVCGLPRDRVARQLYFRVLLVQSRRDAPQLSAHPRAFSVRTRSSLLRLRLLTDLPRVVLTEPREVRVAFADRDHNPLPRRIATAAAH